MEKTETFFTILSCAMELETRKGPLKWTLSELSRKTGITRSLIYYYFGRSKLSILQEAVKLIGDDLIGLGPERMALWREGRGAESIILGRRLVKQLPYLPLFYLSSREQNSEIGEGLRDLEQKYLEKLRALFPSEEPRRAKTIFALMFGLVFTPIIDEEDIAAVEALIQFPK